MAALGETRPDVCRRVCVRCDVPRVPDPRDRVRRVVRRVADGACLRARRSKFRRASSEGDALVRGGVFGAVVRGAVVRGPLSARRTSDVRRSDRERDVS